MISKTCLVSMGAVLLAAAAQGEVRFWNSTAESAALNTPSLWNPAPGEGETLGNDDRLYLNTGTNYIATVSEGESFETYRLYIGRGMQYNWETKTESNSTAYDKGGRVDVTGGHLSVTNELWVGAGYSDNDDDILNISGGLVSAKYLRSGDCAMNNGKRNEINVSGGVLELLGETQLAYYSGGTTYMDVFGSGIVSNTAYFRSSTSGKTYITVRDGGTFVSPGEMRIGQNTSANTTFTVADGGDFTSFDTPHIGQEGKGEMIVDGGTVTFGMGTFTNSEGKTEYHKETYIGQGNNGNGKLTVKSGTVNAYTFQIGRDGSEGYAPEGVLDLQGGVTTCSNAEWYSTFNLGWGSAAPAHGTLKIANDAQLNIWGYMAIGRSGVGTVEMTGGAITNFNDTICLGNDETGRGTMTMSAGSVYAKGLKVANSGTGTLTISGGTVKIDGNPVIADNASATGTVYMTGGTLAAGNDFYISQRGKGHLIMDGGSLSCTYWLDMTRDTTSTAESPVFDFNGGSLEVGYIHANLSSNGNKAILNWNGGVFKPNGQYEYVIESEDALEINVKQGGAIFDAGTKDRSINHTLAGIGFFEKRGMAKTWIKKQADLKGGYRVTEGTLVFEQGVAADDLIASVTIDEGATLDLGNASITVAQFVNNGTLQNGTITVDPLKTATWTNAAGDNDVNNPANWTVTTAGGKTATWVLPDENADVIVPYGSTTPDMSSVACKSLTYTFSDEASFPRGSLPPAVVKNAAAWYDPSDATTVTVAANGGVTAIANKGTAGTKLDLSPLSDTSRLPGYDATWTQNGLQVFALTNTFGFKSQQVVGLTNGQDRTLITLGKQQRNTYPAFKDGVAQETYENQFFPIGLEKAMWDSKGRFDIEMWDGSYHCHYPNGTNAETGAYIESSFGADVDWPDWRIWDMGSREGQVRVNIYPESGDAIHRGPSAATPLNESEGLYVRLGQRWLYNGPSAGLLAESLMFDRALSDDELANVRSYLRAKWLTPSATLPSNVVMTVGSTLDLNYQSWALNSLSGSGTLSNGALTSVGTLNVTVNSDGTIAPITLSGMDFDVSRIVAINVTGADYLKDTPAQTMIGVTDGTLSGSFAGTLTVDGTHTVRDFKILVKDGAFMIQRRPGLAIIIR